MTWQRDDGATFTQKDCRSLLSGITGMNEAQIVQTGRV